MTGLFERLAGNVAAWAGRPASFVLALSIVIIWGVSGPIFNLSLIHI